MKRGFAILIALAALVMASLACGPTASQPTVTVIAPPNGAQIAVGQTVEVLFRSEDSAAIVWVQMKVGEDVVAVQESPLSEGQPLFEGILRWTPTTPGDYDLVLTAQNTSGQMSPPAAVSITAVAAVANAPTPTPVATPVPAVEQPTQTPQPAQPPAQPSAQPPAQQPPTQQPPAQQPPPTNAPPPTNTPPPTPTNTPIPSPTIVVFMSDVDTLHPGECATLQWTTTNATEIYLDQWVVDNPAGQRVVCYDEMGVGVNAFRLTAVNAIDSVSWDIQIVAEAPQPTTINAPFVSGMSGSVSQDGRDLPFVSPGDDGSDIDYEGFITFDIRGLPANSSITSAYLNLGSCATNGDPAGLGDLHVVNLQYGDLDAGDYAAGGAYITPVDPCTIFSIDVTSTVEAMKAEVYYQVRIYFSGSDFDGQVDDVTYSNPTLDITYIIP